MQERTGIRGLARAGTATSIVRKSRFFALAAPVAEDGDGLRAVLDEARAVHPDVGHVVYAWRGRDGRSRSSDDGEPHGTGGRPCLSVLDGADVVDAAVCVARVFGGTLLGVGGLSRAYGEAAQAAVLDAGVRVLVAHRRVCVLVGFADAARLEIAIADGMREAPERLYTAGGVELSGEVPDGRLDEWQRTLAEASGGRAAVVVEARVVWR